jgi:enoyl-CoA hydratase/carnithine racemase
MTTNDRFRREDGAEPDEPRVLYRVEGPVAFVELNRPTLLNAINFDVHRGIVSGMHQAAADEDVLVVVLAGRGRAFSSGGDRGQTAEERDQEEFADPLHTALAIWECPKPVIAEVQGYCLGQGAEIVAVCDLAIAADDARFGEVQITLGGTPPIFAAPPNMTIKQLKEYLLTGEQISAHKAQELGLVNRVVPRDRLHDEVMFVANRIASLSAQAVQSDKKLINDAYERMGFLDSLHAARALLPL